MEQAVSQKDLVKGSNVEVKIAASMAFDGLKGGRYYLINTLPQFHLMMNEAEKQPVIALDSETDGLDWVKANACGIVLGWGPADNYYIPIAHKTGEKQLSASDVAPRLISLFANPDLITVFWNNKYDRHILAKLGIVIAGLKHEGVTLSYLLDENCSHELKDLSKRFIHKDADKFEVVLQQWRTDEVKRRKKEYTARKKARMAEISKIPERYAEADAIASEEHDRLVRETPLGKKPPTFTTCIKRVLREWAVVDIAHLLCAKQKKADVSYDYVPLEIMTPYACADTHYTFVLYKKFLDAVCADDDLRELYLKEMQLNEEIFRTESLGIKIDSDYLRDIRPDLVKEIDKCGEAIHAAVGYSFDVESPLQLVAALRSKGIKLTKLTKGGMKKKREDLPLTDKDYSTDNDVMEYLAVQHPFAQSVIDYRKAKKNLTTYCDGILEKLDYEDYLHSTFNPNVSTGRMSSSAPNVQNIGAKDLTIRRAFINQPGDGYIFVFMDYSQVELRLTAHESQDEALLACYPFEGEGKDVHSLTCAEVVIGINYDDYLCQQKDKTGHNDADVTCECPACTAKFKRLIAKRVNFGIIYGAQGPTIQKQVSTPKKQVTVEECDAYVANYLRRYKGVRNWIRDVQWEVKKYGYVQNAFGRYRRFPDIRQQSKWQLARTSRQAVNYIIQGGAADLFKTAVVRVGKLLQGRKTTIRNFVHDEIQFYWHRDELDLLTDVKQTMEDFDFTVPIVVDVAYSTTNWAAKKELSE